MADGLHFDEALHEYTIDGRKVPSVTTVLRPVTAHEYRAVDRETMERTALLGQAVHKLIELDLAGTLDEDSLSDPLRPYLAMWRQFLAQSGFKMLLSEQIVHSARYGYAGRMDLAGKLNNRFAVIDAKRTAAVPRSAGPQTSAYRDALAETRGDIPWRDADRYALHLTPERWRLVPFNDPNDRRVFLAALTLHNYLEQAA
jgi:hypothetical protein